MNDPIKPIQLPRIQIPSIEKSFTATIHDLPINVQSNIKPGDILLLKLIMESGSKISLKSSIEINQSGQTQEVPVKARLDNNNNLKFQPQTSYDVSAKVIISDKMGMQVKINTVNDIPVEKFVQQALQKPIITEAKPLVTQPQTTQSQTAKPQTNQPQVTQAQSSEVVANKPSTPLSFSSVRVLPIIENAIKEINIPQPVKDGIINQLKDTNLSLSLNSIVDKYTDFKRVSYNPQNPTSILQKPVDNIKNIIQSLPPESLKDMPPSVISAIKNEIISLKTVVGEAIIKENQPFVIKTPLGEIFPDKDIKLQDGVKVLLDVKEPALVSLSVPKIEIATKNQTILEILKPLITGKKQTALPVEILSKIPTSDNKMLSNMLSFIKAASNNNIHDWLGKEVMDRLNVMGNDGKEVIARLNNFFQNNSAQDNINWRIIEVPFLHGDMLSKIKVSIKKVKSDEDSEGNRMLRKKYGTRFVVDTNFTNLGSFQFDGFSMEKDRRFELIVRTQREIPQSLYYEIIKIFKNTLHNLEYIGNVVINVKENFIKIEEDDNQAKNLKRGIYI